MTWQSALFWSEQSHLMAGLKAGLSSSCVSSVAAPLQGLPLMFHDGGALSPSLLRIAFTAAPGCTQREETAASNQNQSLSSTMINNLSLLELRRARHVPSTGSVCGAAG